MKHIPYGPYEKYIKRPLDCVLATGASVVLSPLLAVTAIAVKKNLGSPVIFSQERPGKDEKVFRLYKFRTMTDDRDEKGEPLPDELRLTRFGRILRSTSLDELPELINIIKGDMAIVGPRPLLVKYLPLYDNHQRRRHEVRPGLTGLAQIKGRNSISWEDKFDYDVEYVDRISLICDVYIMCQSIIAIMRREGITSETNATMEDFEGSHRA